MHLAQVAAPAIKVLACSSLPFGLRQELAGLPVAPCHRVWGGRSTVLLELARGSQRLDAIDAGSFRLIHGGEHVLQAVAEFVEERFHFPKLIRLGVSPTGGVWLQIR